MTVIQFPSLWWCVLRIIIRRRMILVVSLFLYVFIACGCMGTSNLIITQFSGLCHEINVIPIQLYDIRVGDFFKSMRLCDMVT